MASGNSTGKKSRVDLKKIVVDDSWRHKKPTAEQIVIPDRPKIPRLKFTKGPSDGSIVAYDPSDRASFELLKKALGTTDDDFVKGIIFQIVSTASLGPDSLEEGANFILAFIIGLKPRDQVETMLALQMAMVHMASTRSGRTILLPNATPMQLESAQSNLGKLTRTYATQLEALKRYRSGGEQKVTVQHVSVTDGGQAIVGNVTQNGRPAPPSAENSRQEKPVPQIADAQTVPMPPIQARPYDPFSARPRRNRRPLV